MRSLFVGILAMVLMLAGCRGDCTERANALAREAASSNRPGNSIREFDAVEQKATEAIDLNPDCVDGWRVRQACRRWKAELLLQQLSDKSSETSKVLTNVMRGDAAHLLGAAYVDALAWDYLSKAETSQRGVDSGAGPSRELAEIEGIYSRNFGQPLPTRYEDSWNALRTEVFEPWWQPLVSPLVAGVLFLTGVLVSAIVGVVVNRSQLNPNSAKVRVQES